MPDGLWVIYLIGGLVGLVVALMFFEWALIVLSSLSGASLIIEAVGLPAFEAMVVLLVLAVAGTILQTRQLMVEI